MWRCSNSIRRATSTRRLATDGAFVFENDLSSDQAYSMAALPDGRIVVGGAMGFGGSDYRATVWCLLPDGTPDPGFRNGGAVPIHL